MFHSLSLFGQIVAYSGETSMVHKKLADLSGFGRVGRLTGTEVEHTQRSLGADGKLHTEAMTAAMKKTKELLGH